VNPRTVTEPNQNNCLVNFDSISYGSGIIRRDLRGKGLTKRIIEAAVQHAAKRGAKVVEAYPVEPGSPSYRFMGYLPTFSAAGFHEVGRAGTRRHVMRRELRK
jgi:GNAT superfamily N-acetyltransferase